VRRRKFSQDSTVRADLFGGSGRNTAAQNRPIHGRRPAGRLNDERLAMKLLTRLKISTRLTVAFAATAGVFLLVGASTLVALQRLAEADRWNLHSQKVTQHADDMLLAVLEYESGVRGALLAGDEKTLAPYKSGMTDAFTPAWESTRQLTATDAEQQRRLEAMKARHAEFKVATLKLVEARKNVNFGSLPLPDFVAMVQASPDKAALAAFRAQFEQFDKAEQALFAARAATADTVRGVTRVIVIGGSLAALALATLLAVLITRSVTGQLGGEPAEAAAIAARIAEGDLSHAVSVARGDDHSLLAAMARMQASLQNIIGEVRAGSESIATGATQIATGNADLSQRTEVQAGNVQKTASSMEELHATVKNNADTARQATQLAQSASSAASRGGDVVAKVVTTMGGISGSSQRIADIIGVIDGIAFQTNILALNAAVEAARAGEQGRGFAVVATEVRTLAQRSAAAAKEIKTLIGASVEQVQAGTQLVDDAGSAMKEIVSQVQRVSDLMAEISAATVEQTSGIGLVNDAVTQLDQATQQNAALVEESAAAADSLRQQAQRLVEAVGAFRVAA
jgi:methyl-accepting chemotaxis protein